MTVCCRWYVASGSLHQSHASTAPLEKGPHMTAGTLPARDSSNASSNNATPPQRSDSVHGAGQCGPRNIDTPSEHCVILMRGVVWKSEEVEVMNLWQNLLRFWPVTFADRLVTPAGALQAHSGRAAALAATPAFMQLSMLAIHTQHSMSNREASSCPWSHWS